MTAFNAAPQLYTPPGFTHLFFQSVYDDGLDIGQRGVKLGGQYRLPMLPKTPEQHGLTLDLPRPEPAYPGY